MQALTLVSESCAELTGSLRALELMERTTRIQGLLGRQLRDALQIYQGLQNRVLPGTHDIDDTRNEPKSTSVDVQAVDDLSPSTTGVAIPNESRNEPNPLF